ncbi:hypothetical protein K438DRAFT_1932327, partial [Mycena galopus ATCC 62051]
MVTGFVSEHQLLISRPSATPVSPVKVVRSPEGVWVTTNLDRSARRLHGNGETQERRRGGFSEPGARRNYFKRP